MAHKGIIDLRNIDLHSKGFTPLDGQWEFFPGQILQPRQAASKNPSEKMYISQPTNWKGKTFRGEELHAYGKGTYRLKILLNRKLVNIENNQSVLGLKIIEAHSAYKLWINDSLWYSQGIFTEDNKCKEKTEFSPLLRPATSFFHPGKDTVTVTINVENYFDKKMGGIDDKVLFGTAPALINDTQLKYFVFIFSFGILLVMGVYNLLLSFIRKEEKASFYLGIISLLFAVQAFWEGERSVYLFFPSFNTELYYKIWILSLWIFPLLHYFYQILFPADIDRRSIRISNALFTAYSLIILIFPYSVYSRLLDFVLYFGLLIIAYVFHKLIFAFFRNRQYSGLTLFGFLIPVLFAVNDILFGLDLIVTGYYGPVGFAIYIVFQSFVLSSKYAHSYEKVSELSLELKNINDNLETTIKERTQELKSANENLKQLDEEKSRLFSIIAHDLRNPFAALQGLSEILLDDDEPVSKEEMNEYLRLIHEGAEKGGHLLENLLYWAKLKTGDTNIIRNKFNLSEMAMETVSLLRLNASAKNQILNLNIPADITAHADRFAADTILRNLISNAIKFTPGNGIINISAEVSDNSISVSVSDTGTGIPDKDIEKLFRPGIKYSNPGTNRETGSGLGLILCKELAIQNNGEISIISQQGKGSTFTFTLPAAENNDRATA